MKYDNAPAATKDKKKKNKKLNDLKFPFDNELIEPEVPLYDKKNRVAPSAPRDATQQTDTTPEQDEIDDEMIDYYKKPPISQRDIGSYFNTDMLPSIYQDSQNEINGLENTTRERESELTPPHDSVAKKEISRQSSPFYNVNRSVRFESERKRTAHAQVLNKLDHARLGKLHFKVVLITATGFFAVNFMNSKLLE